jgi:hypothetical protein
MSKEIQIKDQAIIDVIKMIQMKRKQKEEGLSPLTIKKEAVKIMAAIDAINKLAKESGDE